MDKTLGIFQSTWRRIRDLNSCGPFGPYELSKPTPSASWESSSKIDYKFKLTILQLKYIIILMLKQKITYKDANQRIDKYVKKYFSNAPLSFIYK